jgi:hypothetical protein
VGSSGASKKSLIRGRKVAEKLSPKEIVTFEELLVSSMFEQDALVNLLERKGLITKAELLEEIKALKKKQKR